MPALVLVVTAACFFAVAYRYLGAFVTARALSLVGARPTPAVVREDGHDYVPTSRWILLGHHFAAISGADPLIGPVLAAQFGCLPGFLWPPIGVPVAGTVHDSVLHDGRSLPHVAREELGPAAGWLVALFVVFLLVLTMAGASIAVVNALGHSAWGVFTVAAVLVGPWIEQSALAPCFRRSHEALAAAIPIHYGGTIARSHVPESADEAEVLAS